MFSTRLVLRNYLEIGFPGAVSPFAALSPIRRGHLCGVVAPCPSPPSRSRRGQGLVDTLVNRPIGRVRTGLPRIDPSVSFPLGHGHQSVDVLQIIPEGQLPEGFVSSVRSAGCIGIEDPVGIESPVRRPVPEED